MHISRPAWQSLIIATILFACACGRPTTTEEKHVKADVLAAVAEESERAREDLIRIRRDLHQHPELSNQESRTAGVVAKRLGELGIEVREGVGGHGVVAILRGSQDGPVVAYRADMDAIPMPGALDTPYATQNPGVRHNCGHDAHTTVALGIAQVLSALREHIHGTVILVFQPAEETLEGARRMLAEDVYDGVEPAFIFAVHSTPFPSGQMGIVSGMALSGLDSFRVTFDSDFTDIETAQRCNAEIGGLRTIEYPNSIEEYAASMTDQMDPETAYKDFVFLWSGLGQNEGEGIVIAGMVKTSHRQLYYDTRKKIEEILENHVGDPASYEIVFGSTDYVGDDFEDGIFPAAVNDPDVVARFSPIVREVLGEENLIRIYSGAPFNAEDFALFLNRTPGAMFWLGVANADRGFAGAPHSPDFDIDEESLVVGTKAMSAVLLEALVEAKTSR
jgi:metal-dependent amidase/aminoacylase/carboxypeptidase family protein